MFIDYWLIGQTNEPGVFENLEAQFCHTKMIKKKKEKVSNYISFMTRNRYLGNFSTVRKIFESVSVKLHKTMLIKAIKWMNLQQWSCSGKKKGGNISVGPRFGCFIYNCLSEWMCVCTRNFVTRCIYLGWCYNCTDTLYNTNIMRHNSR